MQKNVHPSALSDPFGRRAVVTGIIALTGLSVAGCGAAQSNTSSEETRRSSKVQAPSALTVYRDPSCGCCEAWAEQAKGQGFAVTVIDRADMPAIKRQHGVPEELSSCHTAIVAGYAIEGHVPLADVRRLLVERPKGVRGLAVPGMPRGSPGMEMPDGSRDPYQVMAFDAEGRASVFSKHEA